MSIKGLFILFITFGAAMCARNEMWPQCASWIIGFVGFLLADKLYAGEDEECEIGRAHV